MMTKSVRKFGDCLKTETVEGCVRDADIYQRFHPRMLTYFIRCIAFLLPSLILIGCGNWS